MPEKLLAIIGVAIITYPIYCWALSANSYKMVEAIPYRRQICVSSNKARIGN